MLEIIGDIRIAIDKLDNELDPHKYPELEGIKYDLDIIEGIIRREIR